MTRWTEEQLQDFIARGGKAQEAAGVVIAGAEKKNKFSAQRVEADGIKFDSKLEAKRYDQLKRREQVGEITDLDIHPSWPLRNNNGIEVRYPPTKPYPGGKLAVFTADFAYVIVETERFVIEDCKGVMTKDAKLRIAIFEALYGLKVDIIRKGDI